jgi:hypothetical protein
MQSILGENLGRFEGQTANGPMGRIGGQFAGASVAKGETFIDAVRLAARNTAEIADRIEALADRLVGSQLATTTDSALLGKPVSVPNSLFDQIDDMSAHIIANCERATFAINRIERSLP